MTPTDTQPNGAELGDRAVALAKDTGATIAAQANGVGARGMSAVGQVLHGAAQKVEHSGAELAARPATPVEPEHVDAIAQPLHRAGEYLTEGDPKTVVRDIDSSVHKHPYRAMAAGLAAGWVIGRFISGRN